MSARAIERTAQILAAAHALADDPALRQALATHTGLSPQGVAHAFEHHLERMPEGDVLQQLLTSAPPTVAEVTVILAANVFISSVRAAVVAALHGDEVWLRPSRREPDFAEALVRAVAAPWLRLDSPRRELSALRGAVHVYGRADTVSAVRTALGDEVQLRVHGPGFSAVYSEHAAPAQLAAAAAADLVAFDQRGCLSPRVFLVRGAARALAFGQHLHHALIEWHARVPRGVLDATERAELRRYEDSWSFAAHALHCSTGGLVVVAPGEAPWQLSPVGRVAHVVAVDDLHDAMHRLSPWADALVALASDVALPNATPFARVRRCALGALQRPPLDGPVDLRSG